eukprot:TRINITY_DN36252_c0_g1_i1.p1 TRINITY_DN36252_c0_g1~~TRINITY_DN36252_c0_g1_i1.p1  ORF type:complete len:511 (-),score=87.65 TRINITY_DN36252_c0_g1_i1:274-1806(-)
MIPEDELRTIFNRMDADGSGSICLSELTDAMRLLGVKVSANSAKKVLAMIDDDGNGTVEWEEFRLFFSKVADPDEIKNMLSEQNRRFFEYRQLVESDPSFGKTFLIPPSKKAFKKLQGHTGDIEQIAFISDTELISGSIAGEIIVWDISKPGKNVKPERSWSTSSSAPKAIYSMAVSSNSTTCLTGYGSKEDNLQLWDIAKGVELSQLPGHTEPVYACCYSEDSTFALSGSKLGAMCFHDVATSACVSKWQGHLGVVHAQDFQGPSHDILCSASSDGTVKVFDIRKVSRSSEAEAGEAADSEIEIADAAASGPVLSACWRSSNEIVSCGDDFCAKVWDIRNFSAGPLISFFGCTSPVRSLACSEDKRFVVTGTHTGSVRIWAADEVSVIQDQLGQMQRAVKDLGKQQEHLLELMDAGQLDDPGELRDLTRTLDDTKEQMTLFEQLLSQRLTMGCIQAKVSLDGSSAAVASLAWRKTGDGQALVASGSQDTHIRLYEVETAELLKLESWER